MNIGRAKYSFDPKTEKFRYVLGYDWNHRNTDTLCGSVKEDANGKLWMTSWSHGFFIWDAMFFDPTFHPIADPWVGLAAVAMATERMRIGTLVTPIARRR